MSEEKQVKKQLIKNMILNLVTFSIIFSILGLIIYGQFKNSLYISADSELEKTNVRREFRFEEIERKNERADKGERPETVPPNEQENSPRLVFITRNSDGEISDNNSLNEIFEKASFDKNNLNTIYEMKIGNYSYSFNKY